MKKNIVKKSVLPLMLVIAITGPLAACSNEQTEVYQQTMVNKLVDVYNNNSEYNFTNVKFRNITKEESSSEYSYYVYSVAQNDDNPYFIKTKIVSNKDLSYTNAIKSFAEDVSSYSLEFYCTETNLEIIDKLNSLVKRQNDLTSPKDYAFSNATINGYFVMNGKITFDTTVCSYHNEMKPSYYVPDYNNPSNIVPTTQITTHHYYNNKYTTLELIEGEELNDYVLYYLNNIDNINTESIYSENGWSTLNSNNLSYDIVYMDSLNV